MQNPAENPEELRKNTSREADQQPEPTIARRQQVISFPPGDLDDLIFHETYPVYHSER